MKVQDFAAISSDKEYRAQLQKEKPEAEFQAVLDKAVASKEDKDLKAAAQQFEAMFIYQMFQQMRQTVDKSGALIKEGMGEKIFQDMLDYEVSNRSTANNSLGLADIIYKQLKLDQNK